MIIGSGWPQEDLSWMHAVHENHLCVDRNCVSGKLYQTALLRWIKPENLECVCISDKTLCHPHPPSHYQRWLEFIPYGYAHQNGRSKAGLSWLCYTDTQHSSVVMQIHNLLQHHQSKPHSYRVNITCAIYNKHIVWLMALLNTDCYKQSCACLRMVGAVGKIVL